MSSDDVKNKVKELVAKYERGIATYETSAYNETEVRVEFLNPLFELLGWDVNNTKGLPTFSCEVRHETKVLVEEEGEKRSKKPDYLFRLGSRKCYFLEAKKPCVDILGTSAPAFQTRRYGWSGNLGISVLSNFRDLVIYDCSVRPQETDAPNVARVISFHYTEYVDRFEEIESWLSRDSVISGIFDQQLSNLPDKSESEPFDDYFLDQIRSWRLSLSEDLVNQGIFSDDEDLNAYVQRILNRILFLRICEDKEYERYEELKHITSSDSLLSIFRTADSKYDSGLFEMVAGGEPMPSTQVLLGVLEDLYYPRSSYDFNVVDPFVMGQIYDLFLCEEAHIAQNTVSIVKKGDLADSEGAVCTPRTISDSIVNEVIDLLLEDDPERNIEDIRTADICCGSGVFLISAFERLCDELTKRLSADLEASLQSGKLVQMPGDYRLSFATKRSLLLSCIFGVDIDPAAVEVARFNLLVKLLEDSDSEEIDAFRRETGLRILPNLDLNIKNGNSLVDSKYYDFDPQGLSDVKLIKHLKPFDWGESFSERFDAVVGNPPYIRIQNIVQHSPREYAYIKDPISAYATAQEGLPDKYQLFIERGLSLLRQDGYLGYIVPNKFVTLQSGATLRSMLADGGHVRKIVNFGSEQLFANRMTYTCILVLGKERADSYSLASVSDSRAFFVSGASYYHYASITLGRGPWSVPDSRADNMIASLGDKVASLGTMAKIFVGLQTSADDIYVIKPTKESNSEVTFIDKDGVERKIEKGILRPFMYKVTLHRFEPVAANRYLVFPYSVENGRASLIPPDRLKSDYPLAFSYLKDQQHRLLKRSSSSITNETWYPFGRSQSLTRFEAGAEHIVWSTLSLDSKYVLDCESTCFTGGGNGPYYGLELNSETRESILYILALMNHPFLESFIRRTSSYFGGNYYSHGKQFVATLPIRRIDFDNPDDVSLHNEIVDATANLLRLGLHKAESSSPNQVELLDRAIKVGTTKLNEMINRLYGLETGEE